MTCYFRHLKGIFNEAGIEITNENKKEVDRIIHTLMGVDYKNCPEVWREIKKRIADDKEAFVSTLKKASR